MDYTIYISDDEFKKLKENGKLEICLNIKPESEAPKQDNWKDEDYDRCG